MIDVQQSCTLADGDSLLPRARTSVLPRGLLNVLRGFLRALHESRRRQAERVLRQHSHLVGHLMEPDRVHRPDGEGR